MQAEQPIASYNGNPQKENGYTPIANELLEAILLYPFTARHLSIILCVCRMTYGYSKKSDALSGWQIANMTNIDRSHISRSLEELIKLNVIIKHPVGRYSHGVVVYELSLNKHYDTWTTVAKTARVPKQPPLLNHGITVAETATEPLPKQPTHKAIKTTKANSQKTSIPQNFTVSDRVIKWAAEKGFHSLDSHYENFLITCEKFGYKYANWDTAFMDAIRKNWAKVPEKPLAKSSFDNFAVNKLLGRT
jgi:phage replication O-like protein O